eukprot:7004571-Alexandrium_andersonii.AAC.1
MAPGPGPGHGATASAAQAVSRQVPAVTGSARTAPASPRRRARRHTARPPQTEHGSSVVHAGLE